MSTHETYGLKTTSADPYWTETFSEMHEFTRRHLLAKRREIDIADQIVTQTMTQNVQKVNASTTPTLDESSENYVLSTHGTSIPKTTTSRTLMTECTRSQSMRNKSTTSKDAHQTPDDTTDSDEKETSDTQTLEVDATDTPQYLECDPEVYRRAMIHTYAMATIFTKIHKNPKYKRKNRPSVTLRACHTHTRLCVYTLDPAYRHSIAFYANQLGSFNQRMLHTSVSFSLPAHTMEIQVKALLLDQNKIPDDVYISFKNKRVHLTFNNTPTDTIVHHRQRPQYPAIPTSSPIPLLDHQRDIPTTSRRRRYGRDTKWNAIENDQSKDTVQTTTIHNVRVVR